MMSLSSKPLALEKTLNLKENRRPAKATRKKIREKPKILTLEQIAKMVAQKIQEQRRERNQKTILWLSEKFPQCFTIKNPVPLKKSIHEDIFKLDLEEEDPSKTKIRKALALYTSRMRYLQAFEMATHRYDLQGNPTEEITEKEKLFAHERLMNRKYKRKSQE
ncbi:MAG: ProQ/FinO family protein [Caedimonas sp.]|jgi:sRNA-binding protein|nr:ProQ/FinO family protein [Caedimonas sp.]